MKLLYSIITFLLLAFSLALPLNAVPGGVKAQQDIQARDISEFFGYSDDGDLSLFSKRDDALLTATFTQMNKSGSGVKLAHGFATNKLTQGTLINLIENYITATGLTKLLQAADTSGLAVDITMAFFKNEKMVPGLIEIIKTLQKNGVISIPFISKRDLLEERGLFDFVGDIGDKVNNLFNGGSDSDSDSTSTTTQQSTSTKTQASSTTSAGDTSLVSDVSEIVSSQGDEDDNAVSSTGAVAQVTQSETAVASSSQSQTESTETGKTTKSSPTLVASSSSLDGLDFLDFLDSSSASSAEPSSEASSEPSSKPKASTSSTKTNPILGLFDSIQESILGINDQILQEIMKLINKVSDLEEICESLQKSGLAVSVLEDFITTTDGRDFVVKLVTAIVEDEVITWKSLLEAVNTSGIVVHVGTTIMFDSELRSIVLNYLLHHYLDLFALFS